MTERLVSCTCINVLATYVYEGVTQVIRAQGIEGFLFSV